MYTHNLRVMWSEMEKVDPINEIGCISTNQDSRDAFLYLLSSPESNIYLYDISG